MGKTSSSGPPAYAHHPFRKRGPTVLSHHATAPAPRWDAASSVSVSVSSSLLLTLVLLLLALIALTVAIQTVRHFLRPEHRRLHVVLASSGAIFLGFCTMVLPPLDVYATASHSAAPARLKAAYLTLFATEVIWLSVVLPFSFFFSGADGAPVSAQNATPPPPPPPPSPNASQERDNINLDNTAMACALGCAVPCSALSSSSSSLPSRF
jgi:hypothetical protein